MTFKTDGEYIFEENGFNATYEVLPCKYYVHTVFSHFLAEKKTTSSFLSIFFNFVILFIHHTVI